MTNQAQAVMVETIKRYALTAPQAENFTITGTMAEGGALWTVAQELYPDAKWLEYHANIEFADSSKIQFVRDPSSMFSTTYKVVGPTWWKKYPPASKQFVVRKHEREWVGNYRREQWVIVFESDDKGQAYDHYHGSKGAYYSLTDESVNPAIFISGTTEV